MPVNIYFNNTNKACETSLICVLKGAKNEEISWVILNIIYFAWNV